VEFQERAPQVLDNAPDNAIGALVPVFVLCNARFDALGKTILKRKLLLNKTLSWKKKSEEKASTKKPYLNIPQKYPLFLSLHKNIYYLILEK